MQWSVCIFVLTIGSVRSPETFSFSPSNQKSSAAEACTPKYHKVQPCVPWRLLRYWHSTKESGSTDTSCGAFRATSKLPVGPNMMDQQQASASVPTKNSTATANGTCPNHSFASKSTFTCQIHLGNLVINQGGKIVV
jgi:hypothetical protein